ncbi:hypothetical protein NDU88_002201 [Pleurodeles waltl]|uniref:Uncharacterized protein n=1 Tax=Pleurodeles waltl TaxID=8319 RepID=A0AAV7SE72_PLEWA|nr:hypothetical protein NDU88_002201 [Pleurodeles waltl]
MPGGTDACRATGPAFSFADTICADWPAEEKKGLEVGAVAAQTRKTPTRTDSPLWLKGAEQIAGQEEDVTEGHPGSAQDKTSVQPMENQEEATSSHVPGGT